MKQIRIVVMGLILAALSSACGAIPTLPPLDSTVTVLTPYFNEDPGQPEETGQAGGEGEPETTAESPSAPPATITVVVNPTQVPIQASETPVPTVPAEPTSTATEAPAPSSTPAVYSYGLQVMNPHYLGNFARPDLGCDWLGVGGQVFNSVGLVQKDIIIKAGGDIAGAPILEQMTMPLAEPEVDAAYGPGGYEMTLANAPAETVDTLWIQLFDLAGNPLSEQIYLATFDDCQKNLLLVNFIEG